MFFFWSARGDLCKFSMKRRGVVQFVLLSAVRIVQELSGTSGASCHDS